MIKDRQRLCTDYPDLLDEKADPELVRLVRDLDALYAGPQPPKELIVSLEKGLQERVGKRRPEDISTRCLPTYRWRDGWNRSLPARVAAIMIMALGLGVALLASPEVRAQIARVAYLVPGLGIRAGDALGLVATAPVSVSRDEATLTVKNLLSSRDETVVQVEIGVQAGVATLSLPPDFSVTAPQQTRLSLRDITGRIYQPRGISRMSAGGATSGGSQRFAAEWTFEPLAPEVRRVEVLVESPKPFGNWQVQVPVVPVQQAGLLPARDGGSSVSVHGITVKVGGLVTSPQGTAIQLVASAEPAVGFVRSIGAERPIRRLALRDDRGREYLENEYVPGLSTPRPTGSPDGTLTEDLLFPPLPRDVLRADLIVPFVTVVEDAGTTSLVVPVGGRKVGNRIPVEATLALGPYSFQVTHGEIAESERVGREPGERELVLHLDLGAWREGRVLMGMGQVLLNGADAGVGFRPDEKDGQWTLVRLPLSGNIGDQATVTFRNAAVAIQGPWRLSVPVGRSE